MSFNFVPGNTVEVPEIPYESKLVLPAKQTAIVVVDMQNDFVKPGGSLHVTPAAESGSHIVKLLEKARKAKVRIAYTQDTHFTGDREWDIWPKHCEIDTWGWQIIDELAPHKDDLLCRKNRYDGFYGTWLEHYLTRIWNVQHLVITGTVANICVAHTAGSAGLRWFNVVIPANGISAMTDFDQAMALRQVTMLYGGKVVRSVADLNFE